MAEINMRKIKWFWPWQDEKEEAWLRSLSQNGWHLVSVGLPCIYTFRTGEPRDYVYRLDYQIHKNKDRQDYLQLFSDAGWEYLGQMSAWHYFRKEAVEGAVQEIFTDIESKVAKYKRVLSYLIIILFWIAVFSHNVWGSSPYSWWIIIQIVFILVMAGLLYTVIRLVQRIRQLRRI